MLLGNLLVVIEVKKPEAVQQGASQAYVELLCANSSVGFSPIVMLTDLRERWTVMWFGANPNEPGRCTFHQADAAVVLPVEVEETVVE